MVLCSFSPNLAGASQANGTIRTLKFLSNCHMHTSVTVVHVPTYMSIFQHEHIGFHRLQSYANGFSLLLRFLRSDFWLLKFWRSNFATQFYCLMNTKQSLLFGRMFRPGLGLFPVNFLCLKSSTYFIFSLFLFLFWSFNFFGITWSFSLQLRKKISWKEFSSMPGYRCLPKKHCPLRELSTYTIPLEGSVSAQDSLL